jgi:hypothetical protein
MGFLIVSLVLGGLGFLPAVVARNLFARCVFGLFATLAAGIAIGIWLVAPKDGIGVLAFLLPFLMLWALSILLFAAGLFILWMQSVAQRSPAIAGPKSGSVTKACPSCGTPYRCDDYREGVESRCVECHEPLEC